jgi:hypothetical protein
VVQRGRRDEEIGLREGAAGAPSLFDQQAPLEQDILGDVDHTLAEERPHLVREPCVQSGAVGRVCHDLDVEPNLGERHAADVQTIDGLRRHEGHDPAVRLRTSKLRDHDRVEQPVRHSSTSRTGIGERRGSRFSDQNGDACITSTRA